MQNFFLSFFSNFFLDRLGHSSTPCTFKVHFKFALLKYITNFVLLKCIINFALLKYTIKLCPFKVHMSLCPFPMYFVLSKYMLHSIYTFKVHMTLNPRSPTQTIFLQYHISPSQLVLDSFATTVINKNNQYNFMCIDNWFYSGYHVIQPITFNVNLIGIT